MGYRSKPKGKTQTLGAGSDFCDGVFSAETLNEQSQLSGGCELTVVLQDFSAGHSSELSIQVGQTVELLERPSERPGWCLVRTTERSPPQEGLVPSSTLCISHSRSSVEMDCFFPLVKEVSGILTKLAGLRREWGEISGERVCCELPWAPFPRQQNARALEDAELQFGDGLLPSDFGRGGPGVIKQKLTEIILQMSQGVEDRELHIRAIVLPTAGGENEQAAFQFSKPGSLKRSYEEQIDARYDSYSHSSGENGGKSESVANLQSQHSLNSIHSSPGPKRSTNTLKKWLTSPVRRLNSGKADGNIKKQKKVRDGRKRFELGSPKPGDETTPQGDSADEKSKKGWGEDEPDEESHTPLPPPMKIFDNDPTQDEMSDVLQSSLLAARQASTDVPTAADLVSAIEKLVKSKLGFMKRIEEKGVPEDMRGKDKMVFGNIHQIYDWHKDFFLAELEKCIQEQDRLAQLFIKHERKLHIYVWYCQNKPRSEYIVAEYDAYFEVSNFSWEVKQEINQRLTLSDFLIKPIQRITKYQLLLKDFLRYSEKAGLECSDIEKAVELMCLVPKRCNDMMNLGRLQGFEGTLTAQGKLLQQDTFYVIELDAGMQSRTKERRVFLFEQIVIFSELLRKGSLTPGYMFKKSIKMNYLVLEENVDNDPCKFALMNRETSERVILQAANSDIQQAWVQDINQVLETQRDFLNALQSPIEYQRKERGTALVRSQPPRVPQASPRPYSSVPVGSEKPPKGSSYNPPLPPLKLSTSNGSPGFDYHQPGDKFEASKQNDLGGCNGTSSMAVIKDYYALKENEICVSQGEVVQVLAVNQQNMCLVYQPASDHSPAAEGWVPGSILAPLTKATAVAENSDGNIKKSCSWHTLRMRKRAEVENTGKNEATGPRKPKDILGNRVSVKKTALIGIWFTAEGHSGILVPDSGLQNNLATQMKSLHTSQAADLLALPILNPNFIQEVAPEFLVPLVDVTCLLGDTVILQCRVCGRPKPTIIWKGPDQNILDTDNSSATSTISSCDSGEITLKICNLMPQDSGIYTCIATNDHGTASTSATVKVQGVPAAPNRPIAQERSCTSVILRWLPPASTGNCTISGYTVEYREEGSQVWQQSVASTLDTYLVIEDLSPGCPYQFRVSASNPWGISLPREASEFVHLPEYDAAADGATISWKENFDSAYTELNEIGRGRFSIVKKCIHKATRKDVAVKFVSKKMKKKEQAAQEAALLQHLQHPQYVTLHDTYESPTSYILILELMDDGRLLDYLMNHDELMEEKVAFYIRDIMEALQYLHNCRVAHLDIKPENLLIDLRIPVPRVKLIDLEDAVQISGHFHIHHLLGNPEFAAPEVIQGIPVSLSTDIWSIGVLTYVMLSGVSPFLDESKEETCINVCRVDFSFPHEYFCGVSNAARDFINVILQEDFRRRPTAATCLQHPWLQPHNGSYSKIPLDTSRLACFIERRKHQNDVRPIPNVKSYIVNRVNQGT
ncbi:Kalirin [Microtus ochrogaster]|uniref:Kalirin n=1 Tax=Microtus ochrogaster TaxID=79684 RepID=A0A8J6G4N3_MICOH|nr:Kalirin [Microtus ochrogaster]